MPRRALFALLAVLAVAGCAPQSSSTNDSAGDFRGAQRQAAQAIEDLESAASDGDQAKICRDLLSRALAGRLASSGRSCPATVDEALKDTDSFDITVESVRVNGERATARVKLETGDDDRRATISLVREGNRWRIASF
jgi:putative lumazine-binding protein